MELYCPTEYGATLWDLLWEAGSAHGMAGRRLSRDRRAAGREGVSRSSDITPDDTPLEAGIGFAVRLDRPVPFTGQAALRRQMMEGGDDACAASLTDPRAVVVGSEPVRAGEEIRGG